MGQLHQLITADDGDDDNDDDILIDVSLKVKFHIPLSLTLPASFKQGVISAINTLNYTFA